MATYAELFALASNDDLRNKVAVAVSVRAAAILQSQSPTAGQIAWAEAAIRDPGGKARELLNYVLAANMAATVEQITGATDTTIQTAVDTAVNAIIAGGA